VRKGTTKRNSKKKPVPRGPKPEILKLEGNWKDAVKQSLAKNKPAEGWPK
jgi:hypothetical protein